MRRRARSDEVAEPVARQGRFSTFLRGPRINAPTSLDGPLAAEVRRLSDRAALAGLADRYLGALDDGVFDQSRARSVFTDDVSLSFPPGDHHGIAGVAEFNRGFMRHWARTHHNVAHCHVELDGSRATVAWNVFAVHVHHDAPPPPASAEHFYLGGRFNGTAVRTHLGWRLRRLTLRVVWTAGPGVASIAAVMARGGNGQINDKEESRKE